MRSQLRPLIYAVALCLFGLILPGNLAAAPWPVPPRSSPQAKSLKADAPAPGDAATATIPGPLRSFLRMAAISQQVSPEEVLPLLARNVVVQGYSAGKPTEFLLLFNEYLLQARELAALAGKDEVIRVQKCEDAKPLLAILGYKMRLTCGTNAAV